MARRILQQQVGKDPDFVFPHRSVSKPINKAWVKAGLPDQKLVKKGINNLRITFSNRLGYAGASEDERNVLLGLKYSEQAQQYAVMNLARLAELVEATATVKDPDLPLYFQ